MNDEFDQIIEIEDDVEEERGLALVKDFENLLKDEDTGAVINTDDDEYETYLELRDIKWREENEKNQLKFDIDFLKTAVIELQQKVMELQNES
jgi:hypothetical protein|tara:strand:+ start:34533 stop:34811 length:279 start_codon:yes stop_codon:yes gene_type:complete